MSTFGQPFPMPCHPEPKLGEPAWDLALMYPLQGYWSVEDYLRLNTGMLVEYTDGFIRVLPMPTILHQWIVQLLFRLLDDHVKSRGLGEVFLAPLPIELAPRKYREPDVAFVRPERIRSVQGQPAGADLVVEVVSQGRENRERDYVQKREEYAAAGIAEYWIVDPQERRVIILVLDGAVYCEQGIYRPGETAASHSLPGFAVPVQELFARCDDAAQS